MTQATAMALTYFIAGLAILLYIGTLLGAGNSRKKYNVPSPAMTGHPMFERAMRVQNNTLEQIIAFLPALWLFSSFVDARIGAALGLVWVIARCFYWRSFMADPAKRGPTFIVAFFAMIILLIGGMGGAVAVALKGY